MKRITALIVIITVLHSTILVSAADPYESVVSDTSVDTIENVSETTEAADSQILESIETSEKKITENSNTVELIEESDIEQRMNWTYVENSYLETPGTQRIVVSWGDGTEKIESMSLKVQSSIGVEEVWISNKSVENLYLFEKDYTDVTQSGTYEATELIVKAEDVEKTFTMEEMGTEVLFGVNEEYTGIDALKLIKGDSTEEEVNISVATINDDKIWKAEESIGEALGRASETMLGSTPSVMAADTEDLRAISDTRAGDIVVALDPGHDANDAGARGNGLKEEELTLKIANYCKQELEKYAGVTVYMTRTGVACPYNKQGISCMEDRVAAAVNVGAKIFVSFHLNSTGSGRVYGAEVIVPNNNWKPNIGAEGTALGEKVLDELVKIGLKRRSVYSKDTTVNEYYEDGSKSDYFNVQIECKERGIPGIIVEHAFIDNVNDANNFLKTETGLQSLGIADATGIAKYLGLMKGKWIEDVNGRRFQMSDGNYVKKQFLSIGGVGYYFDINGYVVSGWQKINNKTYYFLEDGSMCIDWHFIDGYWYYFNAFGEMQTGWQAIRGKWYYMNKEGVMQTGWLELNGAKFYLDASGAAVVDWQYIEDVWYYFDVNGYMQTGWQAIRGKWYYMNKEGVMQTGWLELNGAKFYLETSGAASIGWRTISGKKYYFDANGYMQTGWQTIAGVKYYFDAKTGELAEQKTPGWHFINGKWYYYDTNGQKATGWRAIRGKWYYMNKEGVMQTGWLELNGSKFYLDASGAAVVDWQYIEDVWYYFDVNGYMQTGWRAIRGKWYYMNKEGVMQTDWLEVNGSKFYLDASGAAAIGWRTISGKKYYFDANGYMQTGWQTIDGVKYYFDEKTGELEEQRTPGWHFINGKWYYYDTNGQKATGWRAVAGKWYYMNKEGVMQTGWLEVNGSKFYLDASGAAAVDWQYIEDAWYYFDVNGYMQTGWQVIRGKWYYINSNGKMQTGWLEISGVRYYLNEDGVMQTGWQQIQGKWYWFGTTGAWQRGYQIAKNSEVTVQQLIGDYKKSGKQYPGDALGKGGAADIETFCKIYMEEALAEGIAVEVAFGQAMLETGWLQYGGDVKIEQFNFAGLGAVGGGAAGATFKNVREGVRAHIQHLKCYANSEPLNNVCIDPRWNNGLRGKSAYVEWLSIPHNPYGTGWAADPDYGKKLMTKVEGIKNIK